MDGTILGQGFFSSQFFLANPAGAGVASNVAANPYTIQIPSGADWISVRNYTRSGAVGNTTTYFQGAATAHIGTEFFWQRGMPFGSAIVKYNTSTTSATNTDTITSGGFTFWAPGSQIPGSLPMVGNPVAITAISNATQPVVTTASTAGVAVGTIVRIAGSQDGSVNGVDMVVSAVTLNTSFTLLATSNALANAPGAAGTAPTPPGFYSIVNYDPIYYPRRRFITSITQATNAVVATSVPHGYVAGQAIRFNIPTVSGMIQLNPTNANNYLYATVLTVIDLYTFTIDINTTTFTAFTFPTFAQIPCSYPETTPLGENTASALLSTQPQTPTDANGTKIWNANNGILSDATVNTSYLGMILGSGAIGTALTTPITGPAGTVNFAVTSNIMTPDMMFWIAGKSTYGGY
jgi:hypothetical protein